MKPDPAAASASVGRSVVLQAWSGVVAGLLLLGLASMALHDYATSTGDDPLIGVVLLVAAALAVPGVLGVALGGGALALRRRRPSVARTLASFASVVPVIVIVGCLLRILG